MQPRPDADLVIAHSSDLHLGAEPDRPSLAADPYEPLRWVIGTAHEAGAQVLLLAGDIFDHNRLTRQFLDGAAELLAAAELAVTILPGNHDPLTPDSVYRRGRFAELPGVQVLGLSVEEVALFPKLGLEVWGRAHLDYSDMLPLRDPRPRVMPRQVVMAHGEVVEQNIRAARFRASWLITHDELDATEADYIALGHWNRPAKVGRRVPSYYSGSPDFARTINLIHLPTGGETFVERVPLVEESDCATGVGRGSNGALVRKKR